MRLHLKSLKASTGIVLTNSASCSRDVQPRCGNGKRSYFVKDVPLISSDMVVLPCSAKADVGGRRGENDAFCT